MLPDELDDRLRLEARRRGTAIAVVAREAIERQLPPMPQPGELSFFAIGDGDPTDVSAHVDEHVARAVARRHASRD
jgi:predicted DNA-binding protein